MASKTNMGDDSPDSFPALLSRLSRGDRGVEDLLIPQIYHELRRIARRYMRSERPDHTLQATALVHQAYVRLVGTHASACTTRSHFLALASRAMRHVLTDHAVARNAGRRGGGGCRVTLDETLAVTQNETVDGLFFNQLLDELSTFDERQARVVELRVLAGMSFEEIAAVLAISSRTAKRDWSMARAWLHLQLPRAYDTRQLETPSTRI
jgi:RNA polymerase sigma factor (TIGR02999 family)